jgi:hypothetical protein
VYRFLVGGDKRTIRTGVFIPGIITPSSRPFMRSIPSRTAAMTVACVLAASAAWAAPVHWQLPIAMHEGYPMLDVRLPGRTEPLRMVLDTAASHSVIDLALAQSLALVDESASEARVEGAGGRAATMRPGRRTAMQIGPMPFETAPVLLDLKALQTPTRRIDGIVGQDLINRHDMRLDLGAGRLELVAPGSQPHWFARRQCQDNGPRSERPAPAAGFFVVDVQVQGPEPGTAPASVRAVLDTGAASSLINSAARRALAVADGDPRLRDRAQGTQGVSAQAVATQLLPIGGLALAGWQMPAFEVRVSDLPVFSVLGLGGQPAMILGIDVLQRVPWALAAGASRMCLG